MLAVFERLYRWAGPRYLDLNAVATFLAVQILVVPAYSALLIPIYDLDLDTYLEVVALWELCLAPVGAAAMWRLRRRALGPVHRWCTGERGSDLALEVWRDAVTGLPRKVVEVLAWYVAGTAVAVALVGDLLDFAPLNYPVYFVEIVLLIGVVGVVAFLHFEQLVRPVVREAVQQLPPGADLPPGTTLSTKALSIVPVVCFITAVVTAAAVPRDVDPERFFATAVALALASSLTIATVLARTLRTSLVGRITPLREAMRRVDEGDLDQQVLPLAGDEIDDIGRSFNRMVAGLRERLELREDLRASLARIVTASDAARRQVERDLHDGAQQHLVLLRLRLEQARVQLERGEAGAHATLVAAQDDLKEALVQLRDLAHGIYPTMLETEGLPGALGAAARRSGIPTTVDCDGVGRHPRELEAAVYFCCLEALQNAAKHAGADARAQVTVAQEDGVLRFEVADDGAGFDLEATGGGHGLQNMADRLGALGGGVTLEAAPGAGTRVHGTISLGGGRP